MSGKELEPMRWMAVALAWGLMVSLGIGGRAAADGLPEVSAQPEWSLHDRNDDPEAGWVVYRRKPAGSSYDAYRLEAVIDAPPAAVALAAREIMADPGAAQPRMRKTVLEDTGDAVVVYSYIDMPMVSDRDVTTRAERSFDPATGVYRVEWRATDEGPAPRDGVVRLDHSQGSWTFLPLEGDRTRAIYESHTEIAGSIPAWLINSLMTDTVVDGIVKLRARVAPGRAGEGG